MDRSFHYPFSLASFLLLACFLPDAVANGPKAGGQGTVEKHLEVQRAFLQGKDYLLHENNPAKSVEVLEKNLYLIDGDRNYLLLLRNAYVKHIINLHLNDKNDQAKTFLNRLKILDPEAADQLAKNPSAGVTKAASTTENQTLPPKLTSKEQVLPFVPIQPQKEEDKYKFRAVMGEEILDPFSLQNAYKSINKIQKANPVLAQSLLSQAETKFQQNNFQEARLLFEQANQADSSLVMASKDRWAYCKFKFVVDQLNENKTGTLPLSQLENEVKLALALKPNAKLTQTGNWLLNQLAQRQKTSDSASVTETVIVKVKHAGKNAQGWQLAETAYFRIYHNQQQDFVEQVAQIAEQTRVNMTRKWFGDNAQSWQHKCDIYLHATAKDYSHRTGVPPQSPGHSRIETDNNNGQVVGRQIELRCDNPDLLQAVLPHETTHVILAGQFGQHSVPRWVDEGVAVLTEPDIKINLHLKNLQQFHENQLLFHVGELMELRDYPHPKRVGAFYAQSVSLVKFLTTQRGPQVFSQFVLDGLAKGYEQALRKHYDINSYNDLQNRWMQHVTASLHVQPAAYAKK